ncbi:MAG: hypothetical protein ACFE8U_13290 [Candidatus Hermodarchaeota archaeon]
MIKVKHKLSSNPQLNAALLVALLPPVFVKDFKIQNNGIIFVLNGDISLVQEILEIFLSALSEITNTQFYFEIIQNQEVQLKVYGSEGFQFSESVFLEPQQI